MSLSGQVVGGKDSKKPPQALEPYVLAPFAPLPARRPLYPHPDLHLLRLPCKRSKVMPTPPQPKEARCQCRKGEKRKNKGCKVTQTLKKGLCIQ
ncbi:hypothetical protein CORC01_01977 [Colletotrichum orchidophilum]|uniref:Uncharacterized protein n=1 Tax=Colletotrichum orchidophilum TaxID=1209926 RepID=A0A1G4BNK7_9PEZI|nr:uncharacterized protein CORC01_01977 [Colletotrichum orchidophilum]OHF02876.1 hypothetical protein CORC01_01977 [Colletotrichum orchidophilum]